MTFKLNDRKINKLWNKYSLEIDNGSKILLPELNQLYEEFECFNLLPVLFLGRAYVKLSCFEQEVLKNL